MIIRRSSSIQSSEELGEMVKYIPIKYNNSNYDIDSIDDFT